MGKTSISWTEETWNPLRGCSRVSPGCQHCYAETIAMRFSGPGQPFEGYATRGKGWTRKVSVLPDVLAEPLGWRTPRLVFISMSDPFHERLTFRQIAALFGVMAAARTSTFQILTKRTDRMAAWFRWVADYETGLITIPRSPRLVCQVKAMELFEDHGINEKYVNRGLGTVPDPHEWPLPNVWIGTSVENQELADARIPHLLDCPAAVRFLSCEPLLGPIDLERIKHPRNSSGYVNAVLGCSSTARGRNKKVNQERIHWVIAGAESGTGKRACDVRWLRALRDQCWPLTKFFLKQAEDLLVDCDPQLKPTIADLYPISIGKGSRRKKGRLIELPYLDGVQHDEMPEVVRAA